MPGHAIPDEMFPTVMPTGAPLRDFETIDARPAAFGAAKDVALGEVGQGLEHVATAGIDVAEQQARMDAQTHAAELHSWQAQQVTDEQAKFLTLRGRAAIDALPAFQARIDQIRTQALGQAENPMTRQLVDQEGRRLTDVSYSSAAHHAAQQRSVWQAQTASDAATTYGNQAVLAATTSQAPALGDDLTLQRYLFSSDQERRNHASAEGYEGPAIDQIVAKNRGTNVKAIVEQIAGGESPDALKRAYDFYKSQQDKIDAGSRLAIQNFLRGPLNQVAGQKVADDYMHRPPERQAPVSVADIPANFIGAIKAEEGYRSKAYWDVKQHTIGFGTRANSADEQIDLPEANRRFGAEITKAAKFVDSVNPNLDPGTRAALASLTFNAGESWATSGLGAAVRSGDLAKAKEIFLSYNQAGGETNAVLAGRRAREASWFGRGDISPVEALAPRQPKGDVLLSILNDPDLINRPTVQAAALAHVNKVYEAYHVEETQQGVLFKQRLKDSLAEAGMTGTVKNPIPQEDFIRTMGAENGAAAYAEYQQRLKFGATMTSTANNSPDQNDALLEQYKPKSGEANYAQRANDYGDLDKAITQNRERLKKAPADYTMAVSPSVQAARETLNKALSDPAAPLAMRQAAARSFADTMLAEQERLGVPPERREIVSKAYVDALTAKLQRPDTAGGGAMVGATIHAEAELWGEHWPDVYRQVAKNAGAPFRVLGSGVTDKAAKALVENYAVKETDLLKNEGDADTKLKKIQDDVMTAMGPFKSTLVGADRDPTLRDFRDAAVKLATIYTGQGDGAAAQHAVDDLVGFKYDFAPTYRVPKYTIGPKGEMQPASWTADQIASGVEAAKFNLGDNTFDANRDYIKSGAHEYNTKLGPDQEAAFRAWVKQNRVPFDVAAPVSDYDMRGFWKALQAGDARAKGAIDPNDNRLHYPDYWKTPYHESFSRESQWATPDAPAWNERDQLVDKNGRMLFDDRNRSANLPRDLLDIAAPPDRGEGYTADYRMQAKLSALRRKGVWVTDPNERGLVLTYDNAAVRRTDGQPVMLTWPQLVQMGQRYIADKPVQGIVP